MMLNTKNKPEVCGKNDEKTTAGCSKWLLWTIVIGFVGIFMLLFMLPPFGQPSEKSYYIDCSSKVAHIGRFIDWLAKERKEEEKTDECSACDLIREYMNQYGDNIKVNFKCSKDHQAYLIFPVSADIDLYEESVQPPVPVAMCHPGVHGKFGTPVLYSDGTVKALSQKEAEALIAGQTLQPAFEARPEEGK